MGSSSHIWLFTASQRWEVRDVLDLLKADSFGKLEIISIVGWLGILLVKGFSFIVPIIAANSLPWVWQGCLRSNLSAGKLACVTTSQP